MNKTLSFNILVSLAYILLIGVSISAADPGTATAPRYGEPPIETLGKIAQQQSIPASRLWGLKIENEFRLMKGDASPSHRGSNILKFPVVLGFEVQYYLRRPDNFGSEWNFRVFMFPVFRRPFASP